MSASGTCGCERCDAYVRYRPIADIDRMPALHPCPPYSSVYVSNKSCHARSETAWGVWMPVWIAILLQATPLGGPPLVRVTPSLGSPDQPTFSVLRPQCDPSTSAGEIVVCGRSVRRPGQRLERLDSRFERSNPDDDGLFSRRLSGQATLQGGGPKRSVGMTLRIGFQSRPLTTHCGSSAKVGFQAAPRPRSAMQTQTPALPRGSRSGARR